MDVYSGCGLFIQSCKARELSHPCIPPIILKMLYEYVAEGSGLREESMERQLLLSCHAFLGLDTFLMPTAPFFFERQIAHLFRIRMLLLMGEGKSSFTLQDLLGKPQFLWQKKASQTYPLVNTSLLPVHQLTDQKIEEYVSNPTTGSFYFPQNERFASVDFIFHLSLFKSSSLMRMQQLLCQPMTY